MSKNEKPNKPKQEQQVSIHGDILESIFTNVPLIDLVSTYQVSKSWKNSVSISLNHFNKIKPWFIIHAQSTRSLSLAKTYAYDPRSNIWIKIQESPLNPISFLKSSHSSLLYMLSPSKFSFSYDPLNLKWRMVNAPFIWRTDPIVAVIGDYVIVAGGVCDFEDDPLAVEMYDMKKRIWRSCESMPAIFRDTAASIWLSTAVNGKNMYVVEKITGIAYKFDLEMKSWCGPYDLFTNKNLYGCCIGFGNNNKLILVGLIKENTGLKLWEVNSESREECEEICEMPKELFEKLRGDVLSMGSLVVNVMGNFVFLVNNSAPEESFLCEIVKNGECIWKNVENIMVNDDCKLMERLVFNCADVSLSDLYKATVIQGRKFTVM